MLLKLIDTQHVMTIISFVICYFFVGWSSIKLSPVILQISIYEDKECLRSRRSRETIPQLNYFISTKDNSDLPVCRGVQLHRICDLDCSFKGLQLRAQVAFVYYKFEYVQTIMQSCDKPGY